MCCPPTNHVAQIDDKGILNLNWLNLQSQSRKLEEKRLKWQHKEWHVE